MGNTKVTNVFFNVSTRECHYQYTGNNKTLKPTAATVRWKLSFYIVMNSLVLFDSLVMEDCCELGFVDDAT